MRKEISITETADTIENAIDKACKKLGCRRDECSFEIIDRPRKKFFGLVDVPAKVRVSIEVPEDQEEAKAPRTPRKPKPAAKTQPKAKKEPKAAPQPQKATPSRRETAPAKPVQEKAPTKPAKETPAPQPKPQAAAQPAEDSGIYTDRQVVENFPEVEGPALDITQETPQADPKKVTVATQYVENIVKGMGLPVNMEVSEKRDGLFIAINGDNLGTIIGRRGETLDAIQYLTGLATNRLEGDYLRVTVDCGDYRLKREQTLVDLAQRLAQQVLDSDVSKTLEPMNAAERRVIHATVSDIEGVSSHSVGREPTRRVVIKTPTSTSPGRRNRRSRNRRNEGEERSESRQRPRREQKARQQNESKPAVEHTPSKDIPTPQVVKEAPLYGKVDLDLE